jgi:hypothetical protein
MDLFEDNDTVPTLNDADPNFNVNDGAGEVRIGFDYGYEDSDDLDALDDDDAPWFECDCDLGTGFVDSDDEGEGW